MLSKKKIIITLAPFLLTIFFVAPKVVWAQVVINEIAWMGTKASSSDEWIELYNNSNEPISIEGWSLSENENKLIIALKNSIAANSYYLIERTDDLVTNVPADLFGSWGGSGLLNDGEKLSLKDSSGNIIDEIDCSLGWFAGKASPDYQTMERTSPDLPPLATNWHSNSGAGASVDAKGNLIRGTPKSTNSSESSAPTPTPSAAPSASPTATTTATPSPSAVAQNFDYSKDILINEFLPAPSNGEKEWVELFNAGSAVVNLSGWQIDDADNSTSPQVIPADAIIYANGFLVISFNKPTLNNDGDKIRLLWPDDQIVHAVSYNKANSSQSVVKFGSNWFWTNQPTPGQTNKKSAVENNKIISLATAPNNNQIITIEEKVATETSVPIKISQSTPTPKVTSPVPPTSITPSALPKVDEPETNLLAAAGEPVSIIENNSALTLAGVIFLSVLTAGGLIYFRRQKTVDSQNFDD